MQALKPNPRPIDHLFITGDPFAPALVNKQETLSRQNAEFGVGRLAASLDARQLGKGARVATWLPKTIETCLMPLAAPRAGLIHVPVNPMLRRTQVAHILNDCSARILLTTAERAAMLELGDLPEGCAVWLESDAIAVRREGMVMLGPSNSDVDDLAALLYTSGSTGRPKGVMLSHANLWLGAVSVAHYLKISPQDTVLAVLPLGFDYGQNQLFSSWLAGAQVAPFDYLIARDVVRAVERLNVTTIAAVPPLWLQLLETEWGDVGAHVKRLTNSGGALTPAIIYRLQRTFPNADIYPMYGLTEAFRSTYLPPELVASHPTSMGRAIPFADIRVLRPNGEETADDEPGELVHAGPLVAQGYWNDSERTALRFRDFEGGKAVWSGDTVIRDAQGLLTFVGRDDEMIKTSGHRVSPLEIEDVALSSGIVVEAVAHAIPDPQLGQAIRLIVRGGGDTAALQRHFKTEVPGHMMPKLIEWRDEIARNANGKVDRAGIKAEFVS
jgi:acyl-CoA ligase (AMP-forming) (exosortase A-associated)